MGLDTDGHDIYVSGWLSGPPRPSNYSLGGYFVSKHNSKGDRKWLNLIWSPLNCSSFDNQADLVYNSYDKAIYVTGGATCGYGGHFYALRKFSRSRGDLLWEVKGGVNDTSTTWAFGYGVDIDSKGFIYVTGTTTRGLNNQSLIGGQDYFLVKYNSNGKIIWSRQGGGVNSSIVQASGLSINKKTNNIYIYGAVSGQSLIPNQNITGRRYDYYIVEYDSYGNYISVRENGFSTQNGLITTRIGVDRKGSIFIVGDISVPHFQQGYLVAFNKSST